MKKNTLNITLRSLCLFLIIFGASCKKDGLEKDCIVGKIPESIVYKMKYGPCYPNSIWVEVLNNENMGQDVTIYHASPPLHPIEPSYYINVVELIFDDDFLANYNIEELAGRKIYFKYRQPNKEELDASHPETCADAYDVYQMPVFTVTDWSFERCPTTSL